MTDFLPRVPLVHAELHVDYVRILTHIDSRRAAVESVVAPVARRIAWAAVHKPLRPASLEGDLAARLEKTLMATARFGYREARSELNRLRTPPVRAAHVFPDAGSHGPIAETGLDSIRALIRQRARKTAQAVTLAAQTAAASVDQKLPAPVRVAAAASAATRILHNHVLELVGETLNLGRTAGITALERPPEYAMRSEQLDANTCEPCDQLHGTIVEIGSADYYDLMPPSGCLGGGRCRGIYVYGDSADEVASQQAA